MTEPNTEVDYSGEQIRDFIGRLEDLKATRDCLKRRLQRATRIGDEVGREHYLRRVQRNGNFIAELERIPEVMGYELVRDAQAMTWLECIRDEGHLFMRNTLERIGRNDVAMEYLFDYLNRLRIAQFIEVKDHATVPEGMEVRLTDLGKEAKYQGETK